jgi:5-oxopent-3-ene-1,2,5-tricarboxylate decarboxylase/2-hydroxyhepta-2,4-diene-1,7-dioate isomerase
MSFLAMGTVYGTLMNFKSEHEALGAKMSEPPYKAPPKAPVLYVKPANTWTQDGIPIVMPKHVTQVDVGATIAMVMKGPREIAGYVLMTDFSIPHDSFFRPPVKYKCVDGFLGVGGTLLPFDGAPDPSTFVLQVSINGGLRQTIRFSDLVRPAQQLLDDVSEFMTLQPGDVLMLGCEANHPRAGAFDRVELSAEGFGTLANIIAPEAL